MFGKKKPEQETVLLLDVESGSVGSALTLLARDTQPKLFGETRIALPLGYHQGSASLVPQIERAVREALVHSAHVAARLRANEKVSRLGEVARVAVFLSAPWGAPNLESGKQKFFPSLQKSLNEEIAGYLGVGAQFYTGADSVAYGIKHLLPGEPLLVCVVRGETIELLLVGGPPAGGGVLGYATLPSGLNTVLRTLKSHGGMTKAETNSIFTLAAHPHTPPYEPLEASAQHFVEEFAGAAQHLLAGGSAGGVFVIAEEPAGDWFARALGADESLGEYFPQGGVVRTLRAHHLAPHVAAHLASPDLHLLLEALFVGKGALRSEVY
jgi:hypothetical protein